MQNNKKKITWIMLVIALISVFTYIFYNLEKSKKAQPISKTEVNLLGTVCTITLYDSQDEKIIEKAFDRIRELENKMSINIDSSEVIQINNKAGIEPVKVSQEVYYMIEQGIQYAKASQGKFDITIGPLVKLWGIGTDNARVPEETEIDLKKSLIDYKNIILNKENSTVMLAKKDMIIDLGGIAKGYAADEAVKILKENGIEHAIVNLGGNVFALNKKVDGTQWNIGIENPIDQNADEVAVVKVENKTVTTAGIYQRYFEYAGKKYHHILDPQTGYPADNEIASITIIAESSTVADGMDTGVLIMGLNEGLEFLENQARIEGIIITKNKEIYITNGLKADFTLRDTSFVVKN